MGADSVVDGGSPNVANSGDGVLSKASQTLGNQGNKVNAQGAASQEAVGESPGFIPNSSFRLANIYLPAWHHQIGRGGNGNRILRHNAIHDVVFTAAQTVGLTPAS